MKTLVVAEAGASHDGFLGMALELVREAKKCGADVVKFQYVSDPDHYADRRHVPDEYRRIYRKYALPAEWLPKLKAEADKRGLQFWCSTFLPQDVATVAPYVSDFKIASFEAAAEDHLKAHLPFLEKSAKILYVSLGMGGQKPRIWGSLGPKYAMRAQFLHCVSAYPTPLSELNLRRIFTQRLAGFSDHSVDLWSGAVAVAAGATVVEVHFRLTDTQADNPDYPHSKIPADLSEYILRIRQVELMLGTGDDKAQPSEGASLAYRVQA